MGNVMWWIGVLALAGFFELWHRIGLRRACSVLWGFWREGGPRDAARRREHSDRRLYGGYDFGSWSGHDGSTLFDNEGELYGHNPRFVTHDEWDGQHCLLRPDEVVEYPETGPAPIYRYGADDPRNYTDEDSPVTPWPIQKWSDRR